MRMSYEVTHGCNCKTKQWRWKLRGYEVTRAACQARDTRGCVDVVCLFLHMRRDGVTAQPRNSLGVARVSWLRVRATA